MKKTILLLTIPLLIIISCFWIFRTQSDNLMFDNYYGGHMMGSFSRSNWVLGILMMFVSWSLIFMVAAIIYKYMFKDRKTISSAQRTLDNRLANGDVTIEEYKLIKNELDRERKL